MGPSEIYTTSAIQLICGVHLLLLSIEPYYSQTPLMTPFPSYNLYALRITSPVVPLLIPCSSSLTQLPLYSPLLRPSRPAGRAPPRSWSAGVCWCRRSASGRSAESRRRRTPAAAARAAVADRTRASLYWRPRHASHTRLRVVPDHDPESFRSCTSDSR